MSSGGQFAVSFDTTAGFYLMSIKDITPPRRAARRIRKYQ